MKKYLIALFSLFIINCNGKITDEKLNLWTQNERGIKKITEIVKNNKQDMEIRQKALWALIRNGLEIKVKGIVYQCQDKEEVANILVEKLSLELQKKGENLYAVRDTIFSILPYLSEDKKTQAQKFIAEWAFGSLKMEDPREKIKEEVEKKILLTQIEELGVYGVKGAVLLIKNGFSIERMLNFIFSLNNIEYQLMALSALKTLHQIPNIQITYNQIEKIGKIKSPSALNYLLDLALDKTKDSDTRGMAFNAAVELFDIPEIKANPQIVLSKLYKLIEFSSPDDRWSAGHYILKLEGYNAIEKVIKAFKDDGIYLYASEDPMKSIVDFCKYGIVPLKKEGDILKYLKMWLRSRNRIQVSISTVCLKILGDERNKSLLKPLLALRRVKLDDILGEKITISSLAQNAIEGIEMLSEVKKELDEGKISREVSEIKKFAIEVELVKTGEEYKKEVEKRVEIEMKRKKK